MLYRDRYTLTDSTVRLMLVYVHLYMHLQYIVDFVCVHVRVMIV